MTKETRMSKRICFETIKSIIPRVRRMVVRDGSEYAHRPREGE